MSDWWLVAKRDRPSETFICYMRNGICFPPPIFGEPVDSKQLILINLINIDHIAYETPDDTWRND